MKVNVKRLLSVFCLICFMSFPVKIFAEELQNNAPVLEKNDFKTEELKEESSEADKQANRIVIGKDNRMPVNNTRVFPYSACVFLVVEYHNGESMCGSGSMITPTKVLTAGHILYEKQYGYGYAKKIRVCPAHNNSGSPFG